jgi:hypothetical protein
MTQKCASKRTLVRNYTEAYLEASDLLEAPELLAKVGVSGGVVQDSVGAVVVGVGATDNANDGEILAVRAGDGIDHAQASHGERHGAGPDAVGARVPVSSVARIQLVAASNELKPRLRQQVVEQDEVEVAGHGKNVAHPNFHQPGSNVPPQRPRSLCQHLHRCARPPHCRSSRSYLAHSRKQEKSAK